MNEEFKISFEVDTLENGELKVKEILKELKDKSYSKISITFKTKNGHVIERNYELKN